MNRTCIYLENRRPEIIMMLRADVQSSLFILHIFIVCHMLFVPNSPHTHNRPHLATLLSHHIAAFFSNKPINLSFMAFSYVRRKPSQTLHFIISHSTQIYIWHVCTLDRCKIEARNRGRQPGVRMHSHTNTQRCV